MAQTLSQVRALIQADTEHLQHLERELKMVLARRDRRMVRARALGATGEQLAADAKVSIQRVSQVSPKRTKKPADQAAAPGRAPLVDEQLTGPFRPGVTSTVKQLLSGIVTDSWAKKQDELTTVFLDLRTGEWASPDGHTGVCHWTGREGAADILMQMPEAVERVYILGELPGQSPARLAYSGSAMGAVRAWFLEPVPGWQQRKGGHWLPDDSAPIGFWEKPRPDGSARQLCMTLAGDWFGENTGALYFRAVHAAEAWSVLRAEMGAAFGDGAILLTTPASTGRDLWRRSIGKTRGGEGKTYPVLSDELRQLIQSTAGQGRREVIPEGPATIPGFVQYDMRFAYAALAWGLPVGAPEMVTAGQWESTVDGVREKLLQRRGRWLVTATVPDGWKQVGILPAPSDRRLWCYPRTPGETFTTWVGGAEAHLAHKAGWKMQVHEGFHFAEGKPLDAWKSKLTALYLQVENSEWGKASPVPALLVRRALRNMVLMTIGAFAARTHMVSRTAPVTHEGEKLLPANAPVMITGNHYVWKEQGQQSEWVKRCAHPEWSAEIWSRCRTRLLDAPTGQPGVKVGALHVAPGTVLGMRTDALYLASDPGWHDDGAVGRFRLESSISGELARPQDDAELGALKVRAAEESGL